MQSMCEQTVLRFFISLKETFSNAITFRVINKYGKGALIRIATVFQLVYHVALRIVLSIRAF